jgi:hypothetical protein
MVFGRDFLARYDGLEIEGPEGVKAEWADDLAGFQQSPAAIGYALDNIPSDRPPTSLQFRDLCRRAPQYAPKALPAPPVDPEMAKAVRGVLKPIQGQGDREWAVKLRRRANEGYRLAMYQRDALAEVEAMHDQA